ncbi:MAG: 50S ribosomal protein L44e [Candidatus Pacearchaeota archaeon]
MKLPKTVRRYCPYCNKVTEQKIKVLSGAGKRGSLKKGSKQRAAKRGRARGIGNKGRWSKPPITQWKMKTKTTKKTNIIYTCNECKKSKPQKKGKRTGKLIVE